MKFLFLIFLFFLSQAKAATKVAIIDAFFCKNNSSSKVIIKKYLDMTQEQNPLSLNCKDTRQFHGQKVLTTLLEFYKGKYQLEIYLYKVFKKDGTQDSIALKKALIDIQNEKIHLSVMAIGFLDYSLLPKELPSLTFAAAGTSGNGIKNTDILWPQMLDDQNLVLFAHYFESKTGDIMKPGKGQFGHLDTSILNLKKIDYLVSSPSSPQGLSGTSYAVAKASGIILSRCSSMENKDQCLKNFSKTVTIQNSPLPKNTFKIINF